MRALAATAAAMTFVLGTACMWLGEDEPPPMPLDQAILGEWELLCRTDDPTTTECIGREDVIFHKTFHPDGRIDSAAVGGTSMSGTWRLDGDLLTIEFTGGGMTLEEQHQMRVVDDRLVFWTVGRGFGAIYARRGERFVPAASEVHAGGALHRTLDGIGFALDLPDGYRLADDRNDRQRWEPTSGAGFVYSLRASPRSQRQVGGRWETEACPPEARPLPQVGSSGTVAGVERQLSVGVLLCVPTAPRYLGCSVEHTRGYLLEPEIPAAVAVCQSLRLAP